MKYLLPRNYLSYSQLMLWERSPRQYQKIYINGEDYPTNQYMELGKKVAHELQKDIELADPFIEQLRILTPAYIYREYKIETGKQFKLVGVLDGCTFGKKKLLGEFKTGLNWTQKKADDSDQITFYNMLFYLAEKKLFDENYLHWAETAIGEDGRIELTGNLTTFETERNLQQVLILYGRCVKAVEEIDKLMSRNL